MEDTDSIIDERMKKRQEKIDEILQNSDLSFEWKNMFKHVFSEWNEHSTRILYNLVKRLEQESESKKNCFENDWIIASALVPKNEQIKEKLLINETFATCEWKRICFLDCKYEDVEDFCEKTYRGKIPGGEFTYYLKKNFTLVNEEQQIQCIADCYRIKRPIFFSPYSRRAVNIVLEGNKDTKEKLENEIGEDVSCFCLDENGLSNLLIGYRLCRNIEINKGGDTCSPDDEGIIKDAVFAPYDSIEVFRYTYYNVSENKFIAPIGRCIDKVVSVIKDKENNKIVIKSKDKIEARGFWSVSFQKPDKIIEYERSFVNLEDVDKFSCPPRLYTDGDIKRVIYGLSFEKRGLTLECNGKDEPDPEQVIITYAPDDEYEDEYRRGNVSYGNPRKLPCRCIKFSCIKDEYENFLTDYANYVLGFLRRCYPEYRWVGVK